MGSKIEPLAAHEIFWTCKKCTEVNVSNMEAKANGICVCSGCNSAFKLNQLPEYVDHLFRPSRN